MIIDDFRSSSPNQGVITSAPTWYATAPHNSWIQLSNSILNGSQAQLNGALIGGAGGWISSNNNVIDPWCGGFVNTVGITAYPNNNFSGTAVFMPGTFVCLWGGGHSAYQGNEVYAFGPLESNTPQWWCPRPATNPGPSNQGFDSNGNPCACHTYNGSIYVPSANQFIQMGLAATYPFGNSFTAVPNFNFNTANPATNQPWTAEASVPTIAKTICGLDTTNNGIWGLDYPLNNSYGLGFYNLGTNVWSYVGSWWVYNYYYMTGAVDPNRGIWAIWGLHYQQSTELWFYRTNNGLSNTIYQPSLNTPMPSISGGVGSIVYDPAIDCFVVFSGGGAGALLYTVTAPATSPYQGGNNWTVASIAGSGSPVGDNQGTWGRFGLITNPLIHGYTLIESVTGSVYVYKP